MHQFCYEQNFNEICWLNISGVNNKPACGFSFISSINNKIYKQYFGTGY